MTVLNTKLRSFKPFLGALVTGAALLLTFACGGGGGSSTPAPPPLPPSVAEIPEGLWLGKLTIPGEVQPVDVKGLVLASGEARFLSSDGAQFVGTLAGSASNGTLFTPNGDGLTPGETKRSVKLAVTEVKPKISFKVSIQGASSLASLDMNTYDATYDTPLSLANLAGTYRSDSSANSLGKQLTFTVGAQGEASLTDLLGNELAKGKCAIPDPAKNALKLEFTLNVPGASGAPGAGLGYLKTSGGTASLSLAASTENNTVMGTWTRQ